MTKRKTSGEIYSDAERMAIGSPIMVKMMGFILALIVSGALFWVTDTIKDNTIALSDAKVQIAGFSTSVDALGKSLSDLKDDVNSMNTRISDLEKRVAGQGSVNDPWYLIINNLQVQISEMKNQIAALKNPPVGGSVAQQP